VVAEGWKLQEEQEKTIEDGSTRRAVAQLSVNIIVIMISKVIMNKQNL